MDFDKALGKALSGLRKSKKITQEAISAFSSRPYLSEVENGKKEVSVAKINEFAESIEVHPLTILTQAYLNMNPDIKIDDLQSLVKSQILKEITSIHD